MFQASGVTFKLRTVGHSVIQCVSVQLVADAGIRWRCWRWVTQLKYYYVCVKVPTWSHWPMSTLQTVHSQSASVNLARIQFAPCRFSQTSYCELWSTFDPIGDL